MEERWSGILVDITYTVDSIKGVGLRCFSVGVSNGLTVWVVGLFVVSVLCWISRVRRRLVWL